MSEAQILALSLIQTESNKKSSNVLRTFRRKSPAISIATQNSKLGKELVLSRTKLKLCIGTMLHSTTEIRKQKQGLKN